MKYVDGMRIRERLPLLTLWLIAAALQGCAVHRAWKGEPGTDLSSLGPGMTLAQVEAVIGTSSREWYTSQGVRYRLYKYDAGNPPDKLTAAGFVLLDFASLGFLEAMAATEEMPSEAHEFRELAVSYDLFDVAIGIFTGVDTTTVLPEDGRHPGPGP